MDSLRTDLPAKNFLDSADQMRYNEGYYMYKQLSEDLVGVPIKQEPADVDLEDSSHSMSVKPEYPLMHKPPSTMNLFKTEDGLHPDLMKLEAPPRDMMAIDIKSLKHEELDWLTVGRHPCSSELREYRRPHPVALYQHKSTESTERGNKTMVEDEGMETADSNRTQNIQGNYAPVKRNKIVVAGTCEVDKPYKCSFCDYMCIRKSQLDIHMRTHTGEKPFKCAVCDYRSIRKSTLALHMKTHTGEKPFQCFVCNYKCLRKSDLAKHMRTHSEEKPFKCSICNYRSIQKSTLALHMKGHTGEKPFMCSVCNYGSVRRSNLTIHMKTHAG